MMATAPMATPVETRVELHRLVGEDAPAWLGGVVALPGLCLAAAAAALFFTAPAPVAPRAPPSLPAAPPILQPLRAASMSRLNPESAAKAKAEASRSAEPSRPACLPIVPVPFALNSARPMLDGVEAQIAPLLEWLKQRPGATLSIEGHADPRGRERHNVVLSYQRAQAVAAWLATLGASPEQFETRAAGVSQPKYPAPVIAENRMALIAVEGVEACVKEGA